MKTYFRILSYGKPFLGHGLLALASIIVYTLFSVISLFSVIPFLRILFGQSGEVAKPTEALSLWDPDSWLAHGYFSLQEMIETIGAQQVLVYFCVGLVGAIFIKSLARYLSSYFIAPLEQGVIREMRSGIFSHLSDLDLAFFTRKKKGDLLGLTVSDVQVVQEAIIGTLQSILRDPVMMIVIFTSMVLLSWKLTVFTLVILPITGLFINFIAKRLKSKARLGQEALGELIGVLDEFIGGIKIVKAFQKEDFEKKRYEEKNQAYFRFLVSLRRQSELASPITEVLSVGVICMIILYSGQLILSDESRLAPEQFILFIVLFSQFLDPIKKFANALSKIQKGIAAFLRIESLLVEKATIHDPEMPQRLPAFADSLTFDDVSFQYRTPMEGDAVTVLSDISFEVKKGQTVALVGPSGGGKSTLANLVARFFDPQSGTISIDGIPIKSLAISDLRRHLGYVTQEGILFHDTVLANIAYGISNPDLQQVQEAAKVANAHDFIMEMAEGYDTIIGERGGRLSGGQRQRLSIARAIFRNPPILILDEATSQLDTTSEQLVQAALDRLMEGRTSIVIAHRLSTIQQADLILVIDQGKIVERGTHQELMGRGGIYQQLRSGQL